jgi:hypothetical protein
LSTNANSGLNSPVNAHHSTFEYVSSTVSKPFDAKLGLPSEVPLFGQPSLVTSPRSLHNGVNSQGFFNPDKSNIDQRHSIGNSVDNFITDERKFDPSVPFLRFQNPSPLIPFTQTHGHLVGLAP